ncbi:cytidylate kinase family protein [Candidatus Woesearchaeota archaeon]|nr:cytidylate kinase family protein [Candidatus Woesearchaeota archaeon]
MIITISGKPGSGKTTAAKSVAKKLGYRHFSMGDLRGRIAKKHKMTIDELNELGRKEFWTDKEADKELIKIGKKEDNYVIDTWIGFHFIPNSVKIFLEVDLKAGAKRIFKDQRKDEEKHSNVKEVENMLRKRIRNSRARYRKWYNIDFLDKSNYDLVIDTSKMKKKEVVDEIMGFIKKFK